MKKILGGAVGGIWGWLVSFLFGRVWKKWIVPAYKLGMRKAKTAIKKPFYMKKAKDLEDAKTDDERDSAIDDLP